MDATTEGDRMKKALFVLLSGACVFQLGGCLQGVSEFGIYVAGVTTALDLINGLLAQV